MFVCVVGGHCDRAADDHVGPRARRRLHQAVHEPRHQHHDQEAGETEAGRLLVHLPAAPHRHRAASRLSVKRHQTFETEATIETEIAILTETEILASRSTSRPTFWH